MPPALHRSCVLAWRRRRLGVTGPTFREDPLGARARAAVPRPTIDASLRHGLPIALVAALRCSRSRIRRPPDRRRCAARSSAVREGRAIRLVRVGDPAAPRKVLVVGCIHGNERAGLAITKALRAPSRRAGVAAAAARRRSTPTAAGAAARAATRAASTSTATSRAAGAPLGGVFESGRGRRRSPRRARSSGSILRERPSVSIWYHQAPRLGRPAARRRADARCGATRARAGCPPRSSPLLPGTADALEEPPPARDAARSSSSCPPAPLSAAAVAATARAVAALGAGAVAPQAPAPAGDSSSTSVEPRSSKPMRR